MTFIALDFLAGHDSFLLDLNGTGMAIKVGIITHCYLSFDLSLVLFLSHWQK